MRPCKPRSSSGEDAFRAHSLLTSTPLPTSLACLSRSRWPTSSSSLRPTLQPRPPGRQVGDVDLISLNGHQGGHGSSWTQPLHLLRLLRENVTDCQVMFQAASNQISAAALALYLWLMVRLHHVTRIRLSYVDQVMITEHVN